jgi:hypothetical protein
MSELSGMLAGIGLPAIVRFLVGVKKTGCLQLSAHEWRGDIFFEAGRVTHACLGSRTGLSALDALAETLPAAQFVFESDARFAGEPSIQLDPAAFLVHLDELSQRLERGMRLLPPPDGIPALVVEQEFAGEADEQLRLDRASLQTLLAVDGRRTVSGIVAHRQTFDALWHLAHLRDIGVVQIGPSRVDDSAVGQVPASADEPPGGGPEHAEVASHCPKLGFEDDAANSFGRPTRLHRCFATGGPQPLSLEQQRELCFSDRFGTCPRLVAATSQSGHVSGRAPASSDDGLAADDPRIVHLPPFGRSASFGRDVAARGLADHARLRAVPILPQDGVGGAPPTPLRTRTQRLAAPGSIGSAAEAPLPPFSAADAERRAGARPPRGLPEALIDDTGGRRVGPIPVGVITGIAVVLVVLGVAAYLLIPLLDGVFSDDSLDSAVLPNTTLVEEGTPISAIASPRTAAVAPAQTTPDESTADQSASDSSATPAPTVPPAAAANTVFDERFTTNAANWPSSPQGAASVTNGSYVLTPNVAGQFVAVDAPLASPPSDVVVNATFQKLAGPPGGSYGIVVRDQASTPNDGSAQNGQYYVLELDDKGDVSMWRRDSDHWTDLLPWQHSDAVKPGIASNDVTVRAIGNTLSLSVNGTEVATRTDTGFTGGRAGLFVGGDGNQVAVSHFSIQTP